MSSSRTAEMAGAFGLPEIVDPSKTCGVLMSGDDPLIPVFIPALVVLLVHAERIKGAPLTRDEVPAIRDKGKCMMLRQSMAFEMAEKRGYHDIDPQFAWEAWQDVRASWHDNPPSA